MNGRIVDAGTVHEYYPPLVPLLEAWLYLIAAPSRSTSVKTIWALLGSAFAICLAWHLRLALGRAWLAPVLRRGDQSSPRPQLLDGFWTGQADLALTAYLTLATLAVWQWQRAADRAGSSRRRCSAPPAALTKYEGLPRVAVVLLAVLLVAALERCRPRALPALVVGVAVALAYAAVARASARSTASPRSSEHLSQLQPPAIRRAARGTGRRLRRGAHRRRTAGRRADVALLARRLLDAALPLLSLVVLGQLLATLLAFLVSDTAPDVAGADLGHATVRALPARWRCSRPRCGWTSVRPIIRPGR